LENTGAPTTLLFASSFPLGYVGIVAITRFLSLFFIHSWVFGTVFLGTATIIFLGLKKSDLVITKKSLVVLAFLFLATALFFGVNVYQQDFRWVGHGSSQYAYFLSDIRRLPEVLRFPILTLHQDELLYHYFLYSPIPNTFDPIIFMNPTLALNKAGVFFLCFTLLRYRWKFELWPSLAACLFLFTGTSSPAIHKYFILFDSNNPLSFNVHSGRVLGFLFPFLVATDHLTEGGPRMNWKFFLLVGTGLIFTPIQNYVYFLTTILICKMLQPDSQLRDSSFLKTSWLFVTFLGTTNANFFGRHGF
jgi:hypothetical protein